MKTLKGDEIYNQIEDIVKNAESSIKIVSAWLKGSLIRKLLTNIENSKKLEIEVILRASELKDLLITDEETFEALKEKGTKIYLNERLHAKFILVDDSKAVVGSANFTEAGMSEYSRGNIEVAVYFDSNDSNAIKDLISYYEKIQKDSKSLSDNLIGFILNPAKSDSFEFVLLDPEITEQSYVEIRFNSKTILAKVESIYSYDMGFFANPFSGNESQIFSPLDNFRLLFSEKKSNDWKKAAVHSYLNENGDRVKIAVAKVVGEIKNGTLQPLLKPLDVGMGVYKASTFSLEELMKKNYSGEEMQIPIEIGELEGNENIKVYLDLEEVNSRHMAVLGTTGSGKSYFTKLFIKKSVKTDNPPEIFILDPHGEYYEGLKNFGVDTKLIEEVVIPDTILPVSFDDVAELLKELGYEYLVSGNSNLAKENRAIISKYVKPDLNTTIFSNSSLKEFLEKIKLEDTNKKSKDSKDKKNNSTNKDNNSNTKTSLIQDNFLQNYFKNRWDNQKKVIQKLIKTLNSRSKKPIYILNLKEITNSKTRVNIAGLFLRELFDRNKTEKKRRIVILEEAHNFVPEKGYGDVSSGSNNLAFIATKRIAAEGRKFNLGLVIVSQRPAQVSKYILAQTNTQVMFRIINSNDLQTIESFIESAGEELISLLPRLKTGTGIVSGIAVPFSMVVNVKEV